VVLGLAGERRARDFFISHGFQILDQNCRVGNYEVDIVAFDVNTREIVFVEVKTRQSEEFGPASSAVRFRKLRSMRTVAATYLREHKMFHREYRFDVLTVLPNSIDHYENVTW
jgi:putative endonuclease